MVVACAALVVAGIVFMWLRSSDVFSVQTVTATAVRYVSTEEISRATTSARGANLLALSVGPIEDSLEALPYVRSVRVLRRFPHTLEVRVVEQDPIARVRTSEGDTWLASDDGRVLEKKDDSSLPLFVSAQSLQLKAGGTLPPPVIQVLPLVSLLKRIPAKNTLPAVDHVGIALTGEATVHFAGGMELRLGEPTQLEQKLNVTATFIQPYLRDGKQIVYVDASVVDRVAVKAR